jgi:hypothetical protein
MRNAYKFLVGKPKGKSLHRKSIRRWKDNIRKDVSGCGEKLWTGYIWLRI